ncbi:hypothetical protein [Haloarcula laminariae]|uniref:hypothetical protein n=1 Tax=Haloarcula laminariae TaxID=2961577 RepID=UPI0021C56982|nr:hypothetical protein [Halomicroarcula laminariae]
MERTRRDALRLAGVSVAALAAGCLDDADTPAGTPTDQPSETPTETPTDPPTNGQLPPGLERVDEPPYDIAVPDCGDGPDGGRDPLYLCANMATEPSLSFEQAHARGSVLAESGLELSDDDSGDELFAALLTDASDLERVDSEADSEPARLIRETNVATHAVLVVESGWGSGSVYPHVKRLEATDDGVHAFGCHSDPCIVTDDYTSRTTAVRFERPETVETGVVSLTVAPDERWNVAAGEGVVPIPGTE